MRVKYVQKYRKITAGLRYLSDVPCRFPEGPNFRDLQGTLKGPMKKNDNLMIKLYFGSNSACTTYKFLFSRGQIFKSPK